MQQLSHAQVQEYPSYSTYLKFIENQGQWVDDIVYKTEIPAGNIFLQRDRITYEFFDEGELADFYHHRHEGDDMEDVVVNGHRYTVQFVGANPRVQTEAHQPHPEKYNYFHGNDPSRWASNVRGYSAVTYNNIYSGIDMAIMERNRGIKYEFIVSPRQDPDVIRLKFEGAEELTLQQGNLMIKTSVNTIQEQAPYAYQEINGDKRQVDCEFVLEGNTVTYQLGHYNRRFPVIIDPQLIFSTYSGSTADNWGNTACLDEAGNLYSGGTVYQFRSSMDKDIIGQFPATTGAFQTNFQGGDTDVGILKFDSSGVNLHYATYIGGMDAEIPTSMIVDKDDNLLILGTTASPDFPGTENGAQSEFIGKQNEVRWLRNGAVVSEDFSYTPDSLEDGDEIQAVVFTGDRCAAELTDTSETYTYRSPDLSTTLEYSSRFICTDGDGRSLTPIDFDVVLPEVVSTNQASVEWYINDQLVDGENDPGFVAEELRDGDEVYAIVTMDYCEEEVVDTTSSVVMTDVSGQEAQVRLQHSPDISCSAFDYELLLEAGNIEEAPETYWVLNGDTVANGPVFDYTNAATGDELYATAVSSLSCLADTAAVSDTFVIDNDTSIDLSAEIEKQATNITDNCNIREYSVDVNVFPERFSGVVEANLGGETFDHSSPITVPTASNPLDMTLSLVSSSGCITEEYSETVTIPAEEDISEYTPQVTLNAAEQTCPPGTVDFNVTVSGFEDNITEPVGGYEFVNGTDIFVTKLTPGGDEIISSTFVGGRGNDGLLESAYDNELAYNYGDELRGDINVDNDGNVYVASVTSSKDFPVNNAFQPTFGGGKSDGVVFKLSSGLDELLWSSYAGGQHEDALYSIQRDSLNGVYVTGGTRSEDIPMAGNGLINDYQGNIDAFVYHVSPDGQQIMHSTFLGTAEYDQAYFIQVDAADDVYLLGQTEGLYPVSSDDIYSNTNGGMFVHKLSPSLDSTVYSTVVGDTIPDDAPRPEISPTAFLINECENIFIAGWSGVNNNFQIIRDMPLTANAYQKTTDGSDFYFMVLLKGADSLLYSTYFGGAVSRDHVDGGTSRFDDKGIIYQSVCAGCGGYNDFPKFPEASLDDPELYPRNNNSLNCNNGVIKFDLASLESEIGAVDSCVPLTITFTNESIGGSEFYWDFDDGNETVTSTPSRVTHTYEDVGHYRVMMVATDITTCTGRDTSYVDITVANPPESRRYQDTLCVNTRDTIAVGKATGDLHFTWSPLDNIVDTIANKAVMETDSGRYQYEYYVEIEDALGCKRVDTVEVTVPHFKSGFDFRKVGSCTGDKPPLVLFKNNSSVNLEDELTEYHWDFGNGESFTGFSPEEYQYATYDTATVTLTVRAGHCSSSVSEEISFEPVQVPNIFTPNRDGVNETFIVNGIEDTGDWQLQIFNRWGKRIYENEQYGNEWDAANIEDGTYYYLITSPDGEKCKGWVQIVR